MRDPEPIEADAGPCWWQHDQQHEAWVRHELARAAELAATTGGHPEAAPGLERALLIVAELPPLPERDERQPDLFSIAA